MLKAAQLADDFVLMQKHQPTEPNVSGLGSGSASKPDDFVNALRTTFVKQGPCSNMFMFERKG